MGIRRSGPDAKGLPVPTLPRFSRRSARGSEREPDDPDDGTASTSGGDPDASATGPPSAPSGLVPRGTAVGRYIVLALIGTGGMGVVYRAFDPELDRAVAVKLIRAADRSDHGRDQLLREAQALARISHPNVVAVHDVGTVGDQVFVAMELLEGQSLREWLAAGRSWREVVRAFVDAGRGLAAVHRAGLVHRDFKPGNAFVETSGRVRLLDFGLAQPAETTASESSASWSSRSRPTGGTRAGRMAGTPAYMAPEQRAGEAMPHSDQFAFCVALCEALYGKRPRPDQAERDLRGPGPRRLRRAVVRGLRRDPAARFPSMDALVAALEDALDRRGALAIGIGAGLAGVTVLALVARMGSPEPRARCQRADDALATVWTETIADDVRAAFGASGRRYAADTASRVVTGLDRYGQTWSAARRDACEDTWVRGEQSSELLDQRMACLDRRLAAMAAYTGLVTGTVSAELVDRAVGGLPVPGDIASCSDRQALAVPWPVDEAARAEVSRLEARLERAWSLRFAGRFAEASHIVTEVLTAARAMARPPLVAEATFYLGAIQQAQGDTATARATLDEAITLAAEAEDARLLARAAAMQIYVVGDRLGHAEEAIGLATLARAQARLAGNPPRILAAILNNVGNVYFDLGRYRDARRDWSATLAIELQLLGTEHIDVAWSWSNLGRVLLTEGEPLEARRFFERSVDIAGRSVGEQHPDVAPFRNNLARALIDLGDPVGARHQVQLGIAVIEATLGRRNWRVAELLVTQGMALDDEGTFAPALAACDEALAIYGAELDPGHIAVARTQACRGSALVGLGQAREAIAPLERARQTLGAREDAVEAAAVDVSLARALWETGARDRALVLATAARDVYAAAPGRTRALSELEAWLAPRKR